LLLWWFAESVIALQFRASTRRRRAICVHLTAHVVRRRFCCSSAAASSRDALRRTALRRRGGVAAALQHPGIIDGAAGTGCSRRIAVRLLGSSGLRTGAPSSARRSGAFSGGRSAPTRRSVHPPGPRAAVRAVSIAPSSVYLAIAAPLMFGQDDFAHPSTSGTQRWFGALARPAGNGCASHLSLQHPAPCRCRSPSFGLGRCAAAASLCRPGHASVRGGLAANDPDDYRVAADRCGAGLGLRDSSPPPGCPRALAHPLVLRPVLTSAGRVHRRR
jgi:hypothetical protein